MKTSYRSTAFAAFGLFVAVAILAPASSQAAERFHLNVKGADRSYFLYLPKDWKSKAEKPLVIALHGGASNASAMEAFSALDEKAEAAGFAVVYPDGNGRFNRLHTWNSGACCGYAKDNNADDVGFISALIDELVAKNGVDPSRVYVTGISNGAMMAYRVAAEIPQKIAAVAAVAGTLDVPPANVKAPVPVVHFHGTDDKFVPWEGGEGSRSISNVPHTSVDVTIKTWVKANGASDKPVETQLPDSSDDGTKVTRIAYPSPADPDAVVLYKIVGGGHAWPGRPKIEIFLGTASKDISANDIMWDFFKAHPKKLAAAAPATAPEAASSTTAPASAAPAAAPAPAPSPAPTAAKPAAKPLAKPSR